MKTSTKVVLLTLLIPLSIQAESFKAYLKNPSEKTLESLVKKSPYFKREITSFTNYGSKSSLYSKGYTDADIIQLAQDFFSLFPKDEDCRKCMMRSVDDILMAQKFIRASEERDNKFFERNYSWLIENAEQAKEFVSVTYKRNSSLIPSEFIEEISYNRDSSILTSLYYQDLEDGNFKKANDKLRMGAQPTRMFAHNDDPFCDWMDRSKYFNNSSKDEVTSDLLEDTQIVYDLLKDEGVSTGKSCDYDDANIGWLMNETLTRYRKIIHKNMQEVLAKTGKNNFSDEFYEVKRTPFNKFGKEFILEHGFKGVCSAGQKSDFSYSAKNKIIVYQTLLKKSKRPVIEDLSTAGTCIFKVVIKRK